MTQFLKKLRAWLAKLAFWRKRPDEAVPQSEAAPEAEAELKPRAAADAAEPTPETPVAKLGVLARLKRIFTFRRREIEATADTVEESKPATAEAREPKKRIRATETPEPEVPEILETQPNLFTRLKQWLSFRSKAVETAAEPSPEDAVEKPPKKKTRTRDEPEEPEVPEPKPSFFTRLKQWLSFRSKAVETEVEPDTEDVVEKPPKKKIRATDEPEEPEVPEPKPSFFAR
ncbi:MAG: hypothetical protein IV108_09435, partial [Burkholderiales bacterium]|nr:hypothetical protein [Burkholderiales bacterium]